MKARNKKIPLHNTNLTHQLSFQEGLLSENVKSHLHNKIIQCINVKVNHHSGGKRVIHGTKRR